MKRVSLRAIIVLVTAVSIYLYFFPPAKKNKLGAELQNNFDHVFGIWQLTNDSTTLMLQLKTDTSYILMQISIINKDTITDGGKFLVDQFGIRDNSGFGYLTLLSNSNTKITYEMNIFKMKQLELIDPKTQLLTTFERK